jgi:hypothetical protein
MKGNKPSPVKFLFILSFHITAYTALQWSLGNLPCVLPQPWTGFHTLEMSSNRFRRNCVSCQTYHVLCEKRWSICTIIFIQIPHGVHSFFPQRHSYSFMAGTNQRFSAHPSSAEDLWVYSTNKEQRMYCFPCTSLHNTSHTDLRKHFGETIWASCPVHVVDRKAVTDLLHRYYCGASAPN